MKVRAAASRIGGDYDIANLNVHDNQILDASNTVVLCRIDDDQLIEASSGRPLFTVNGFKVYEGGDPAVDAFIYFVKQSGMYDGLRSRPVWLTLRRDLGLGSGPAHSARPGPAASECQPDRGWP